MRVQVYSGKVTQLRCELLVVSCFEDIRPLRGLASEVDWIYGGVLSQVLIRKCFSGKFGECLLFATAGKLQIPKTVLIGLGESSRYHIDQIQAISKVIRQTTKGLSVSDCAVEMEPPSDQSFETAGLVESFLEVWTPPESPTGPFELKLIVKNREKASVLQKIRTRIPGWNNNMIETKKNTSNDAGCFGNKLPSLSVVQEND